MQRVAFGLWLSYNPLLQDTRTSLFPTFFIRRRAGVRVPFVFTSFVESACAVSAHVSIRAPAELTNRHVSRSRGRRFNRGGFGGHRIAQLMRAETGSHLNWLGISRPRSQRRSILKPRPRAGNDLTSKSQAAPRYPSVPTGRRGNPCFLPHLIFRPKGAKLRLRYAAHGVLVAGLRSARREVDSPWVLD